MAMMDTSGGCGGEVRNDTSLESKENVLRQFLMVDHRFTMYFPCLAKASDNDVLSVCRGWTLSRLINMPQSCCALQVDVQQFGHCHAFVYFASCSYSHPFFFCYALFDPDTGRKRVKQQLKAPAVSQWERKDVCMHVLLNKNGV